MKTIKDFIRKGRRSWFRKFGKRRNSEILVREALEASTVRRYTPQSRRRKPSPMDYVTAQTKIV
ncbi:hypothetical protein [Archaeoglobus sp.]|uniref:hypothetical protein n=1 Tax=Archaeoglobus sp. TaxID=1872626 RepID=UPI00258F36C2|nr:hypothetical protein [Archaeoglobus sp.]